MNSIPRRDFALELSNWKKFPKLPAMPRRLGKRLKVEEPGSLDEAVIVGYGSAVGCVRADSGTGAA